MDFTTGSINEEGLINDLNKRGFSKPQCKQEIEANCIDALCKFIKNIINKDYIKISDDGIGMSDKSIINGFDLLRENHKNHKKMGISGLGLKPATKILSNTNLVNIFTLNNNKYRKIEIPWDVIAREGRYSNQIKVTNMTREDILEFNKDHPTPDNVKSGTQIKFKYNKDLHYLISDNFNDDKKNLLMHERSDITFGKFSNITHLLEDIIDKKNITLSKYNYFESPNDEYYTGYTDYNIKYYKHNKNNKDIFVWEKNENEFMTVKSMGKNRYSSKLSQTNIDNNWQYKCDINIRVGMKKNNKIINEDNVKILSKNTLGQDLGYDNDYFDTTRRYDTVKEELSKSQIIRNNQVISSIALPSFKHSSARGDINSLLKICYLRCEISYETFSSQKNDIDIVFGIQSNKNQLNASNIPIPLIRLIDYIKKDKWEEISTYFDNLQYPIIKKLIKNIQKIKLKEIIIHLKEKFNRSNTEPTPPVSPEPTPPVSPQPTPPASPQPTPPASPQPTPPVSPEPTPPASPQPTPPVSPEPTPPVSPQPTPVETFKGSEIINTILNDIDSDKTYNYEDVSELFDNLKAQFTVNHF